MWSYASVWCIGAKSKDWRRHLPSQEELAVLRDLCQVELQFREAFPMAGEEACWVRHLMQWVVSILLNHYLQ